MRRDLPSAPSSDRSQRTADDPLHLHWPRPTYNREMKPLAIEVTHYRETDSSTVKGDEIDDHISITSAGLSSQNAKVAV